MAWEWSHTNEAYEAARENTGRLPRRELLTILREWAYDDRKKAGRLRTRAGAKRITGFRLPLGVRKLPAAVLADLVWKRAEDLRTCTTGGWACYLCPDGCHTVPFDGAEGEGND